MELISLFICLLVLLSIIAIPVLLVIYLIKKIRE